MNNKSKEELSFLEHFGHLKKTDPFERQPEEQEVLTGKILNQVFRTPEPLRTRMIFMYAGASVVAAAILFLFILYNHTDEISSNTITPDIAEVTFDDLPEMDEALIREAVIEEMDEDILSYADVWVETNGQLPDESTEELIRYLINHLTLKEFIQFLVLAEDQE